MTLPTLNTIDFKANGCGLGMLTEKGLFIDNIASLDFTTHILTAISLTNALPMNGHLIDTISGIAHADVNYNVDQTFNSLTDFITWLNTVFNSIANTSYLWKMQGNGLWYANGEHFQNASMTFTDNSRIHDTVFDATFD